MDPWTEAARLRQGLYRVYAVALLPPTADRLDALRSGADWIASTNTAAFSFAPSWDRFHATLGDPPDRQSLEEEHIRLFDAGVDGALCPPVESFHRTSARDGGTASLLARLESWYQRLGLRTTAGSIGLPDHVTTQLETMSVLCGREYDARLGGDRVATERAVTDERDFLDHHLGTWLPTFAARVGRCARLDYHQRLATALGDFVLHEVQLVHLLTDRQEALA